MNHASTEITKISLFFLHQSYLLILKENFSYSQVQDWILLWSLVTSSVICTVKHLLLMNTGQIHF